MFTSVCVCVHMCALEKKLVCVCVHAYFCVYAYVCISLCCAVYQSTLLLAKLKTSKVKDVF